MKATALRLPILTGLLALTIVGAMIYTSTRAKAQGSPPVIELDGKSYLVLNEEQAQKLADMILSQRALIEEQAKKLKQGGCV